MKSKLSFIAFLIGAFALTATILAVRAHWIDVGARQVQAQWDAQIAELVNAARQHGEFYSTNT